MYKDYNIKDEELNSIDFMALTDIDDNGVRYNKLVYYLSKSARLKIETLSAICECKPVESVLKVYVTLLAKLENNHTVVTISRKDIKQYTDLSDATVSRSIQSLVNAKLIEVIDKDTYQIPIDTCYKGNLNVIIKKHKDRQEEVKQRERETIAADSIAALNNKRKLKFNLNGSKSKET